MTDDLMLEREIILGMTKTPAVMQMGRVGIGSGWPRFEMRWIRCFWMECRIDYLPIDGFWQLGRWVNPIQFRTRKTQDFAELLSWLPRSIRVRE